MSNDEIISKLEEIEEILEGTFTDLNNTKVEFAISDALDIIYELEGYLELGD
jgi:hypothetical protein